MEQVKRKIAIVGCLLLVIILPFLFQKKEAAYVPSSEHTLVIITPNNEAVRHEFGLGFKEWYFKKTGRTVNVDWRYLSGTREIIRYVDNRYINAFMLHWTRELGKDWQERFSELYHEQGNTPEDQKLAQELKQAFDASNVNCGIDLIFGGGEVEVIEQARRGHVVPSGIHELHPEWFDGDSIPQRLAGIDFWDDQYRWVGTSHSGFGIIFNRDVLAELGVDEEPEVWEDLANSAYFSEVAMTDPTISTSSNRVFEMIIQQYMQEAFDVHGDNLRAQEEGWAKGMRLIQLLSANARYFTDISSKPVLDVSAGDCAVGTSLDYYGFFQEESLRVRGDADRFSFVLPKGGSAVTPDPVAMFKGAQNPELALAFIEFVISEAGQKLWSYKIGSPGGPKQYALSRPPARKEMYAPEHDQYRMNPNINAFEDVGDFYYTPEWTRPLFKVQRFVIKSACVDSHKELVACMAAILEARSRGDSESADKAMEIMQNMERANHQQARGRIKRILTSGSPLEMIRLQGELTQAFRRQYIEARKVAEGQNTS